MENKRHALENALHENRADLPTIAAAAAFEAELLAQESVTLSDPASAQPRITALNNIALGIAQAMAVAAAPAAEEPPAEEPPAEEPPVEAKEKK